MMHKELKEKLKELEGYIGKTIILNNFNNNKRKFTLTSFLPEYYSQIRSKNATPEDINEYSVGLFGLLDDGNTTINTISYDVIIDAIDNDKELNYSF